MRRFKLCFALCGLLLVWTPVAAQFTVERGVISSGGARGTAGTQAMTGTLGQTAVGEMAGPVLRIASGFWAEQVWVQIAVNDPWETAPSPVWLGQNAPNPFRSATSIRFSVPQAGRVHVQLFDLNGRLIRTLIDEDLPSGFHVRNVHVPDLRSGVYFYRLTSGKHAETRKLIVLR